MTFKENLDSAEQMGHCIVLYAHTHLANTYIKHKTGAYERYGPNSVYLNQINGTVLVNPGSVGQPRDYDQRASFATLDCTSMELHFHRVTYDVASVQREMANLGFDDYLINRLAEGR
jgi:predicted phosphodiesterase